MTDNDKRNDKHKYEGQMKGLHRHGDKPEEKSGAAVKPGDSPKSDMGKLASEKIDSMKTELGKDIDKVKREASESMKAGADRLLGASPAKPAASVPQSGGASSKSSSANTMMSNPSRPTAKPAASSSSRTATRSNANIAAGPKPKGWMWRVLSGYGLASLAGAMTLAAYFLPNADLAGAKPQEAGDWIEHFVTLSGLSWPLIALFGAPFALIGLGVAESRRIHDWTYYALLGIGVALVGFLVKYGVEPDGAVRTLFNNYALMAFLTAGLVAGLVYWVISGRKA